MISRKPAADSRSDLFKEALSFATELHRSQVRKGTRIPYVSHLLAVTAIVMKHGGTEEQCIAALLHDSVEDQGKNYPGGPAALRDDIRERFGEEVLEIVDDCTDSDQHPKPPWRQRKQAYLRHLEAASETSLLVSASDKLHNAICIVEDYRQMGEALWARFSEEARSAEAQLWYYESLAQLFLRRLPGPLAEQLRRTVNSLGDLIAGRDGDVDPRLH